MLWFIIELIEFLAQSFIPIYPPLRVDQLSYRLGEPKLGSFCTHNIIFSCSKVLPEIFFIVKSKELFHIYDCSITLSEYKFIDFALPDLTNQILVCFELS